MSASSQTGPLVPRTMRVRSWLAWGLSREGQSLVGPQGPSLVPLPHIASSCTSQQRGAPCLRSRPWGRGAWQARWVLQAGCAAKGQQ